MEKFGDLKTESLFQREGSLRLIFCIALLLSFGATSIHFFLEDMIPYFTLTTLEIIEFGISLIVILLAIQQILKDPFEMPFSRYNVLLLSLAALFTCLFYGLFAAYYQHNGENFYLCAWVATFLILGQWIKAFALKGAFKELDALYYHKPKFAHLLFPSGDSRIIAANHIKKGDYLQVQPGEQIPVDGTIKHGHTWVNQFVFTQEQLPIYKKRDDEVLAGSINGNHVFSLVAEKTEEETVISQIISTLKKSQGSYTKREEILFTFMKFLTPLVLVVASIGFLGILIDTIPFHHAVNYFISFLLVVSPSALLLGIILPFRIGLGNATKNGIYFKDSQTVYAMASVDTLVIDKTGTLTEGIPMLTKIYPQFPFVEEEVLRMAASLETLSDHPFAHAIITAAHLKQMSLYQVDDFQTLESKGVIGRIDGSRVVVGTERLLAELKIDYKDLEPKAEDLKKLGQTIAFVAIESKVMGLLAVSDIIKFSAEEAVRRCQRENMKVILITGDSKEAAHAMMQKVKLDDVHAELLPQEKLHYIQKLQQDKKTVALIGEVEHDMPALIQANVGIALGAFTEVAFKTSITGFKRDLFSAVKAREISTAILSVVKQNFIFTFLYYLLIGLFVYWNYPFPIPSDFLPILALLLSLTLTVLIIFNSLKLARD